MKRYLLPLLLWRVEPPTIGFHRPFDCDDVMGEDGLAVVSSLTFEEAQEIVNVHNKAMEEWANGN